MKFVDAVDGNEGSTIRNYENTDQKVSTLSNRQAIISPANDKFSLASGWRNKSGPVVLDRNNFYHVLRYRARYCYNKSSLCVCLSVRDIEVQWSQRLEFFKNYLWLMYVGLLRSA